MRKYLLGGVLITIFTLQLQAQPPAAIIQLGFTRPENQDTHFLTGVQWDFAAIRSDLIFGASLDFWRSSGTGEAIAAGQNIESGMRYWAVGLRAKYMIGEKDRAFRLYAGFGAALHIFRSSRQQADPSGQRLGMDLFSGGVVPLSSRIHWIVEGGYRIVSELSQSLLTSGFVIKL